MTSIEWTRGDDGTDGKTWNPVRGCSRVSEGCRHSYAEGVAARFSGPGQPYEGLAHFKRKTNGHPAGDDPLITVGPRWTGEVRFVPEMLAKPLSWKKPRRVFVNSMSDLFHEGLTNEQIAAVFAVMAACPQHTFQILTKRPARMVEWFAWIAAQGAQLKDNIGEEPPSGHAEPSACVMIADFLVHNTPSDQFLGRALDIASLQPWPLSNVWLGVSTENQETANERIPLLLRCPAAVRCVSAEPLLGPIDFEAVPLPDAYLRQKGVGGCLQPTSEKGTEPDDYTYFTRLGHKLDWVIVGGESAPGARPCDVDWIRSIVKQCADAGVPCFVKQVGDQPQATLPDIGVVLKKKRKGNDPSEWPEDLRVREFPEVRRG
jgi:protein gp37